MANEKNIAILLSNEELSLLKGGQMSATSTQVSAVEMGKESCCNVVIEFGKSK